MLRCNVSGGAHAGHMDPRNLSSVLRSVLGARNVMTDTWAALHTLAAAGLTEMSASWPLLRGLDIISAADVLATLQVPFFPFSLSPPPFPPLKVPPPPRNRCIYGTYSSQPFCVRLDACYTLQTYTRMFLQSRRLALCGDVSANHSLTSEILASQILCALCRTGRGPAQHE